LTVQSFAIVVGKTLDTIEGSFVVVDTLWYKVDSPLTAIEVAFKAYFALNAKYSIESSPLWYLVQIGIYIRTRHDKAGSNARVTKVLADFGLKL